MKAKLKKAPAVIITVLVVLVLVFYISYQIYSAANPVYKTETAIITEVTDGINCSGMIFRDEVTIPIETDGVVEFTSEDGSKVAQGYTVAKVYSTKEAARKNAVGYLYSEKADLYEQIEQSADVASTNIESLSNELYDSLKQLSSAMDEHSGFSSAGNSAVSNLYMFKQASGSSYDLSATAAETRAKADEYTAEASDEYITASQAGYFCSRTDGFEGTATSEKAMTVTADELSAMMNSGTYESGGCKLITSYTWYFAALVPADVIDRFTVGDDISITFGDDSDKTLPVEVVRAEAEDGAENGVVVFSCNDINSEIAEARFENCRINFYDYKGIMVQRSALHVVDGETGVYVKYGTQVIFKKIDPVYSTKDYVISRLNTSDDGYLRLYDEIITEGKDLYDGRDLSR